MKAVSSHTIRTKIQPKAGPQAVGRRFTHDYQREQISKHLDTNSYFGKHVSPRIITASTTLTPRDDGAVLWLNSTTSIVTSLPAAADAPGMSVRVFVRLATTGGTGHAVSPVAADSITVKGFTVAVDKDAINTQATSALGDSLDLVSDGVSNWLGIATGTWARES